MEIENGHNFLKKMKKIIALQDDMLYLIENRLKKRVFYFEIDVQVSNFYDNNHDTIQGSLLCPVLYAIYVFPHLYITNVSNFANNNYALTLNKIKKPLWRKRKQKKN